MQTSLIQEEVNDSVPQILAALPRFERKLGEGMIGLCFVDPFRLDLDFEVLRQLGRFKMDFLVMLPFGFDLRRNLSQYLVRDDDARVARLIDCPDWRAEWRSRGEPDRHFVRFALGKFDEAMERLDYRRRPMEDAFTVRVRGMGVYLYSLALYTRHELGEKFWKQTLQRTDDQLGLSL